MKKITLGTAFLCSAIVFSYCKKEAEQQTLTLNTRVNRTIAAATDFILEPHSGNKSNLGQADIN